MLKTLIHKTVCIYIKLNYSVFLTENVYIYKCNMHDGKMYIYIQLTSINIALKMIGNPMAGIVEL